MLFYVLFSSWSRCTTVVDFVATTTSQRSPYLSDLVDSLALLLSTHSWVRAAVNLYDIVHTPGVAADLSHCETASETTGFKGKDEIEASLVGAEIVVIPAGES